MVILFIEEEEEEVEEEENGYKKGRRRDLLEMPIGEIVSLMVQDLEIPLPLMYPKRADKMMNG